MHKEGTEYISFLKYITKHEISKIAFERALKVHQDIGHGLLESAYHECLFYELKESNLKVEKQ